MDGKVNRAGGEELGEERRQNGGSHAQFSPLLPRAWILFAFFLSILLDQIYLLVLDAFTSSSSAYLEGRLDRARSLLPGPRRAP